MGSMHRDLNGDFIWKICTGDLAGEFVLGLFFGGQLIGDLHRVFKRGFKMSILNGDFLMRILNWDQNVEF